MKTDRRAIRRARDVLAARVHSGIVAEIREGPDGKPGLYVGAKFNAEQWEAICEWAEVEHADPEELVEDLIRQLLLSWRREHDARGKS